METKTIFEDIPSEDEFKFLTDMENAFLKDGKYIHLGNKMAKITPTQWDYQFEIDQILKIDHSNIFGEIITIPVFVNRMGLLCAEMRNYCKKLKLYLDMEEATKAKLFRNKKSSDTGKKPTVAEVEEAVMLDPHVKNIKYTLIRAEEHLEKIESMYNAAKDKSFKLNSLSKNLTPEMFENDLLEGTINGVNIQLKQHKYKQNE